MAGGQKSRSYLISAIPALVLAQFFAVAAITLMLVWLLYFRGGVSLKANNSEKLLNAHHLLMLFGPIICIGEAIMAFKLVPGRRKVRKVVHMLLNLSGLVLGGIGLYAIFKVYTDLHVPSVHSLHSWVGLAVMTLFFVQFLVGFVCFLFPGARSFVRAVVKPWHVFFGLLIFALAVFNSGTGLIQRFRFLSLVRGSEALVINFTGVAILFFGVSVILSVVLP